MDAFEVLQTSIGPALHALEQGSRNRLLLAQVQNERAYRDQSEQRARSERRADIQSERQYSEQTEQRRRTERKADMAEERLRDLRSKAVALGGDPTGKSEEQLARDIHELSIADAQRQLLGQAETKTRADAVVAGVTDAEKRPLNEVVRELAEKQADAKLAVEKRTSETRVAIAKSDPAYPNVRANLGGILAKQAEAMAMQGQRLQAIHGSLSEMDKSVLAAKLYGRNPKVAEILARTAGGPIVLNNLRKGDPGAYDQFIELTRRLGKKDKANVEAAMLSLGTEITTMLQFEKEQLTPILQTYLRELAVLPDIIRATDREMDRLYSDPEFGPALRRESRESLVQEYTKQLPGTATTSTQNKITDRLPPPASQPGSAQSSVPNSGTLIPAIPVQPPVVGLQATPVEPGVMRQQQAMRAMTNADERQYIQAIRPQIMQPLAQGLPGNVIVTADPLAREAAANLHLMKLSTDPVYRQQFEASQAVFL